jgi:hypothetical protein
VDFERNVYKLPMPRNITNSAIYLALVQLLFSVSWAIYDIFLPRLAASAGISKDAASWLSLTDQFLVIFMDIAFGLAAPMITKAFQRAGNWIVASVWFSCLAFLLLPFIANINGTIFLVLVILWVVTSSAIRLPVMILLSQNVSRHVVGGFAAIVAIGKGLASALGGYLTSSLADVNPAIPFVMSSISIGLVIVVLRWVMKNNEEAPPASNDPERPVPAYLLALFAVSVLLIAAGFQFHGSRSAALYLAADPTVSLGLVMPIFWVGFHLALYPASLLSKKLGPEVSLATGAALSAFGCLSASSALSLSALVLDQFLTGAGWALFFMSGIALAISMGIPNRVGLYLASWSALHATATFTRLYFTGTALPEALSSLLWAAGAFLLLFTVVLYRRTLPATGDGKG